VAVLTIQEVSNLLASRITNEEEEEVLEEYEQMRREALKLPDVPMHKLPQKEPEVIEDKDSTVPQPEREEERQAILA
jgi:hypothetical protein